jgi:1-hydroxycarotenoid 3,4-desaturase
MAAAAARVVVVGAGVGGLASAIELAAAGHQVVVLERAAAPGGKARVHTLHGTSLDAGPTVLTMRWVFEELFESAGASLSAALSMERASIVARHAWLDGTRLDLHADQERSAREIASVFGAAEAAAYRAFCSDAKRIYEFSEDPFLRSQRMSLLGLVRRFGARGLTAFRHIDSMRSMWQALSARFKDPRLVQLFGRYATYCGASPFDAPATLNLIAHVENQGVYRVKGGTAALIAALVRLARSLGVELLYEQAATQVVIDESRVVRGVLSGERMHCADVVIWNGDDSALANMLAANSSERSFVKRSLSAVTWGMLAEARGFPLVQHNVFFSDDYRSEFDSLLRKQRMPAAPTVYVCAQDRGDSALVQAGDERLLVVVNAPATGDQAQRWNEAERERCTEAMMTALQRAGLTLAPKATCQTTPLEFQSLFPGSGGALYGPRSRGALSVLERKGARTKWKGLYMVGGSVHPGPGVPMAAQSGRLAAAQILADLASTGRWRPAVTTGTTSTVSAKTVRRRS